MNKTTSHTTGARFVGLILVAALAAGLAGCGGRAARDTGVERDPGPLPLDKELLAEAGLKVKWQTVVPLPEPQRVTKMWLLDSTLVALDDAGRIYVIDAATGVRKWAAKVTRVGDVVYRPSIAPLAGTGVPIVWVPTTSTVWGFRLRDGRTVLERRLEGVSLGGGSVCNGERLYAPDPDGDLRAVGVAPGAYSWTRWMPADSSSAPAMNSQLVFHACHSGEVDAIFQGTRRIQWQYTCEDAVVADLTLTPRGLLLVPSLDYNLYGFNAMSGRLEWRFPASEPIETPAHALVGQAYVFTEKHGLRAVDTDDGTMQWQFKAGEEFVGGDDDTVYVRTRDRRLASLQREDGEVNVILPMIPETIVAPNATSDGTLYLVTPQGNLAAIVKRGPADPEPF